MRRKTFYLMISVAIIAMTICAIGIGQSSATLSNNQSQAVVIHKADVRGITAIPNCQHFPDAAMAFASAPNSITVMLATTHGNTSGTGTNGMMDTAAIILKPRTHGDLRSMVATNIGSGSSDLFTSAAFAENPNTNPGVSLRVAFIGNFSVTNDAIVSMANAEPANLGVPLRAGVIDSFSGLNFASANVAPMSAEPANLGVPLRVGESNSFSPLNSANVIMGTGSGVEAVISISNVRGYKNTFAGISA